MYIFYNHLIYYSLSMHHFVRLLIVLDPRVADWLFMGSPFPLLGITFLYLLFVLRLGPLYMKHRKPYNLNKIMIFYNTFMATASATAFYGVS